MSKKTWPCEACGTPVSKCYTLAGGIICDECAHDWYENGITSRAILGQRRREGRTLDNGWKSRSEVMQQEARDDD